MMRHIITILLLSLALAGMAQPVTRIRLITLQNPPDTTTQYFIQAGGGRDTIKYVPVDSIGGGGENIYTSDGTLTTARTLTMNNETLTIDMDTGVTIGDTIAIRIIAPDGEVNGWYISDADGPVALIVNAMYSTDIHKLISHTIGSTHVIEVGNTSDTLKISADKLFLNELNMATDNTVTQILGYKSSTDEIVFTDGSGTGAAGTPEYGGAYSNSSTTLSVSTSWTLITHMVTDDVSSNWAWSTSTDRLTYSGSGTDKYKIEFDISAHCSTSTYNELTVSIRENGTETTARGQIECVDTGVTESTSGSAIITVNNGDYFDLGAYWTTGTSNISIKHINMIVTKL